MDEQLEEIFRQVSDRVSIEEFEARVNEKVSLMGGLCDPITAAMLVAHELGAGEILTKIKDIRPESGAVTFIGRVVQISEVREFSRSDGSTGRVASLTMGDETGMIKVTLWDDATDLISSGDIRVDQCLKIRGFPRLGRSGVEISIGRGCSIQEADRDIKVRVEPLKIAEIKPDMGEISIIAKVIDPGEAREFARKDGSRGFVRSMLLGDDTGSISITLWNDHALIDVSEGDVLEFINCSSRERYGFVELQTSRYTVIRKSSTEIKYYERFTPIADLRAGEVCNIAGYLTGIGELREFQRDDGTKGYVTSINVTDETGRVRVSLWGDLHRLLENADLGYRVEITGGQVKNGWNGELEISCGRRSRITFAPPG
ncbi:OB-fold nucleic acid binding domain-containing protein [Methanothrix sp.]|uniref:OB-fold nucleic acid binding domain-containing protein n=1 Tax=Methanothrix sp. TaxID=90426 RepID=UPI0034E1CD73